MVSKMNEVMCLLIAGVLLLTQPALADEPRPTAPPFRGTIFDFPDLMRESDATAFVELKFVEQGERGMFDRRIDRFETFPVFIFEATYRDRKKIEVAVNREFETEELARVQAAHYAEVFGRLPLFLRREIDALHIQAGKELFGGGRRILIHTEQGEEYSRQGILEETLGHEAAHALDRDWAEHPEWQAAQEKDPTFISTYALENPRREDIAESVIPYLAVRLRPERITARQKEKIEGAITARMEFFDSKNPGTFPGSDESQ